MQTPMSCPRYEPTPCALFPCGIPYLPLLLCPWEGKATCADKQPHGKDLRWHACMEPPNRRACAARCVSMWSYSTRRRARATMRFWRTTLPPSGARLVLLWRPACAMVTPAWQLIRAPLFHNSSLHTPRRCCATCTWTSCAPATCSRAARLASWTRWVGWLPKHSCRSFKGLSAFPGALACDLAGMALNCLCLSSHAGACRCAHGALHAKCECPCAVLPSCCHDPHHS